MKKKIIILVALVAVPLCISLSSCSSDSAPNPDEETPLPPPPPSSTIAVVSTFAGNGTSGYADGTGKSARFNNPQGIAIDASGNLYVADSYNSCIRKITPAGEVTTFASRASIYTDDTENTVKFNIPYDIAIDASGNLYVTDYENNHIYKVNPAGEVTALAGRMFSTGYADGTGNEAEFSRPRGITIDASGNLYVADFGNNRIRKITPAGEVTTLAGSTYGYTNGMGSAAEFNGPSGITIDASGNLYVTDEINNCIRKVTPEGLVTTFAGSIHGVWNDGWNYIDGSDGWDADDIIAMNGYPSGITIDVLGNLYVTDLGNNRIRKVNPAGEVITLAGRTSAGYADGVGSVAQFRSSTSIAIDDSGNLYVADTGNNCIRKIVFK